MILRPVSLLNLLIFCIVLFPLGAEEFITNGGFEKSFKNEKWHVEYPTGFYGQYFPHSRITTDKAHVHSGEKAVHLLSDLFFSAKHIQTKPGSRFRISVWAKGTGRLEFLLFEYGKYAHIIQENILGNVSLGDQYRQYSFDYESGGHVTEKRVREVGLILPCLRFRNEEETGFIDDWSMKSLEPVEKKFDLKVHWPGERILALSESERKKATLVARTDYDTSSFWELPRIKGRPFWFTLRTNWYKAKWLEDEPLLKYSMPQVGFDQRKFAALRELELYGPEGGDNLARIEGSKPIGERWKQLKLLNDGKAPTDTAYKWTIVQDVAYNGYQWEPVKAAAGIEFPKPLTVSRAVIHHGHNMNVEILGEPVAQADIADVFALEFTTDGKTWREITGTRTTGNRSARTEHRFKPVTARAVRVHIYGQAAPIPPRKGKAWKNIWWAIREHTDKERTADYESERAVVEDMILKRPFIGMEPYRREAYFVAGEDKERLQRYFKPVMTEFARRYKDTLLGFLMWEWENDLYKGFRDYPATRDAFANPKSWRAMYDYIAKGMANAADIYQGYLIPQGNGQMPYGHYLFELGARAIMEEMKGGYGSGMFQVQTTFMRSASRQYGRPWGTYPTPRLGHIQQKDPDKSEFYPVNGTGGPGYGDNFVGPERGVSRWWWKRMLYGNYFAGETFQDMELDARHMIYGVGMWKIGGGDPWGDPNRGHLVPQAVETRDFARFADRNLDRGMLYTPLALVVDYWGGWTHRFASWRHKPLRWGDDEITEMMLTFFPVAGRNPIGFGYEVANKDMADTPYGECFDVLKPNPPSGVTPQKQLEGYKVLWLAGSWREVPPLLTRRLQTFVQRGGTLVVNAAHLKGSPMVMAGEPFDFDTADFSGVEFTGEVKKANEAIMTLDDEKRPPLKSEAFRYAVLKAADARVVARTPSGDPLITLNKVGKGHVILSAAWHNLTDQRSHILPAIERLITFINHQAQPVEVKGRIRYLVTRRDDGWVVALLNNKGIFKSSQSDPEIDHHARQTVDLVLRAKSRQVSEWTQPYTNWPFQIKEDRTHCGITVPAGDVRVLFFKTK